MQAAIAEPTDGLDDATPGVFLTAVEARRRGVLSRLDALAERDRVAELIFDLLTHLALNPDAALDEELFDSFARRHRLDGDDGSQLRLPASLGGTHSLRDELTRGLLSGPGQEAVNALFTVGYDIKLRSLDVVERRNFTLRVVAMLPGVERFGPYVLTDYLDVVCDEDDALRFWQIYVDRVAAEIGKRGGAPEGSTREPWLLSRLLALHAEGPMAPRGAWLALTRHVNRILQAHRHRWRFIRHLAEGCHEPRMLCYLCTSPAMVEDPEVIPVFLTRGNSRLVSCALLALYVYRDAHRAVEDTVAQLRQRPFAEIAGRLVEIYGQVHLFPTLDPGGALGALRAGVLSVAADRIAEAPLDLLPNAVPKDSRSLRQTLMLVDVEPALRRPSPAFAQQYLERAVGTWLQTFTPSGADHPLNDEIWRATVRRALVRLIQADPGGVIRRIEAFAGQLPETAEKWSEGDTGLSHHLAARFVALFGSVWLGVSRALYQDDSTQGLGLACYEALIRVFATLEPFAQGSGGFGALEYVIPGLFPDLLGGPGEPARISEAAALVARTEASLYAPPDLAPAAGFGPASRPRVQEVPSAPAPEPRAATRPPDDGSASSSRRYQVVMAGPPAEPVRDPNVHPLFLQLPTRERPLTARTWVDRRPTGKWAVIFRSYTGLEILADLWERMARLLGIRRAGQLTLTDREVVVTRVARFGEQDLEQSAWSMNLDDITGVRVQAQFRLFPLVLGGLVLLASAFLGGHLLFVGLRTDDTDALSWAGGLLAGGTLFDAALSRLARVNARTLLLELHGRDARQTLRVLLDAREGAEVLDAFMAHDAARRELEVLRRWEDRPEI